MLEQKQERAAALPREAEKKAIKALQKELAALQQPLREAGCRCSWSLRAGAPRARGA